MIPQNIISVSASKGKFEVSCPFHMHAAIRDVPGKRWSAKRRVYIVPFSRKAALSLSNTTVPIQFDAPAIELMASASRPAPPKEPFPSWYRYKTTPMPHQQRALSFLWGKETGALFMAMRTGKTKVVIDWSCGMKMNNDIDHVLVFCPLSVRSNWEMQFAEHAPISAVISRHDLTTSSGKKAQVKFSQEVHPFKVMVVGIESMAAGCAFDYVYDFVSQSGRVLCVVDECHMVKTHNATRSERIAQIGSICSHRTILTGTPITKSPLDLYSQFAFLDKDIIGYSDWYSFKARYAVMGGYERRQIVGYENLDELMTDVAPYVFQINAEDVVELPPKTYQVREVELSAPVRSLYNKIKKSSVVEHNGKLLVMSNVLDKLLRLVMLSNGVMSYGEGGTYEYEWVNNIKIDELLNLVEENPVPTVVWANGRMELAAIVAALKKKGLSVVEMHGSTSEDARIANVAAFQSGAVDYLVANTATGGVGIKLSRAKMLVYMSNSFRYVDRKQSEERATDFINVGEGVLVVDIVARDTVDDLIVQPALQAKQDIAMFVNSEIGKLKLNEGGMK